MVDRDCGGIGRNSTRTRKRILYDRFATSLGISSETEGEPELYERDYYDDSIDGAKSERKSFPRIRATSGYYAIPTG